MKRLVNRASLALSLISVGMTAVSCSEDDQPKGTETGKPTPYVTKVIEYMPAAGQFVNAMPEYEPGDTQEDMNRKALMYIGNNNRGVVSLGAFGGYITLGFDHTIENKSGLCDFRVLGNSFIGNAAANQGGSFEPGIIEVAYDKNGNGMPDEDEWYEIAGSASVNADGEYWYQTAAAAGNDMNLYKDYEITYYKPSKEPVTQEEKDSYIRWTDNKGNSGFIPMNAYYSHSYYPQWTDQESLTFKGTRLPQNAVNEGTEDVPFYVLYRFEYGYADNALNTDKGAAIDIDWAVDDKGNKVHLDGVDFVRIYTGISQVNGWLGECSTEIMGVEDLHLLGEVVTVD